VNFFNRFSFFLIGVILGCVLLFFSLQFRSKSLSFNYFPESRVKKFLIKNKIGFSDKALCKFNCYNLDRSLLDQYISSAVVDFKNSKIRGHNPKTYYLNIDLPIIQDNCNKTSCMIFETDSDTVKLIDIFLNSDMPFHQVSSHLSVNHCSHCF
tara:strand:- start:61 stop:519 length:459 start_codon:yes stop_codon:yes gene_type:complete